MLETFYSVMPAFVLLAKIWIPILLVGGIVGVFLENFRNF